MKANEGGYLTQIAYDIPIEERIFVKALTGVKATSEYYREATDAEVAEWEDYKKKQEEFVE
jgi:hypothetical protein